jgi:hypothetical protein
MVSKASTHLPSPASFFTRPRRGQHGGFYEVVLLLSGKLTCVDVY